MRFISIPFSIVYSLLLLLFGPIVGAQTYTIDQSGLNTIFLSPYHFPVLLSTTTIESQWTFNQLKSAKDRPILYCRIMNIGMLAYQPQINFDSDKVSKEMINGGLVLLSASTVALIWNKSLQKQNNQSYSPDSFFKSILLLPFGIAGVVGGISSIAGGHIIRTIAANTPKKETAKAPTETF